MVIYSTIKKIRSTYYHITIVILYNVVLINKDLKNLLFCQQVISYKSTPTYFNQSRNFNQPIDFEAKPIEKVRHSGSELINLRPMIVKIVKVSNFSFQHF